MTDVWLVSVMLALQVVVVVLIVFVALGMNDLNLKYHYVKKAVAALCRRAGVGIDELR